TANVSIQSGATWTNTGAIAIGANSATGSSATATVTGVGSSVTQSGATTLTVGTTGSGAVDGTLALAIGGAWTTGTGVTTINQRGIIDIQSPSSTFNASGNVLIDGGVLQTPANSTFNLAAGKTFTVQNGGRASFTGGYTTATNAVYNVTGVGSK